MHLLYPAGSSIDAQHALGACWGLCVKRSFCRHFGWHQGLGYFHFSDWNFSVVSDTVGNLNSGRVVRMRWAVKSSRCLLAWLAWFVDVPDAVLATSRRLGRASFSDVSCLCFCMETGGERSITSVTKQHCSTMRVDMRKRHDISRIRFQVWAVG